MKHIADLLASVAACKTEKGYTNDAMCYIPRLVEAVGEMASEIAQLRKDNADLVQQMNAMAKAGKK